jgi:hypothetical protein
VACPSPDLKKVPSQTMQSSSMIQAANNRCSQDKNTIAPSNCNRARCSIKEKSTIVGSDLYTPSDSYMTDIRRMQQYATSYDASTSSSVGVYDSFFADAAESYPVDDLDRSR